jgi:hypothetical protein
MALGAIRIDLLADVAKFVSGINTASNRLTRFGSQVSGTVKSIDRAFTELGGKLTLKVTAPLAGLAVAAVRAADPTKQMGERLERLGLQAQAAIKPLGEVLIRLFDEAEPTLRVGIGLLNQVSEAFAGLEPRTQKMIVLAAGLAAATGPALLALSGVAVAAKAAGAAIAVLYPAAAGLLSLSIAMAPAIAAVGVALASWKVGEQIYENFAAVQKAGAYMATSLRTQAALIQEAFVTAFRVAGAAFNEFVSSVTPRIPSGLADLVGRVDVGAAGVLRSLTAAGAAVASAQPTIGAEIAAGQARAREAVALEGAALRQTMEDIDRQFRFKPGGAGGAVVGATNVVTGLAESVQANRQAIIDGVAGIGDAFQDAADWAIELGEAAPPALVMTRKETDAAKKAAEDAARKMEQLADRVQSIREGIDPWAKFTDQVKDLDAALAAGILTLEEHGRLVVELRAKYDALADKADDTFAGKMSKAITGFSDEVSSAFADLVVDGETSFEALAKSFEKMLLKMALNELAFKPIFAGLGSAFGSLLGAPSGGTQITGIPVPNTLEPVDGVRDAGGPVLPGRRYLVGERRPELFVPNEPGYIFPNPQLGGGAVMVQVIDQRGGGAPVEVSEASGPGGQRQIQVLVRDEVRRQIAQGGLDRALGNNYGLTRRPASR